VVIPSQRRTGDIDAGIEWTDDPERVSAIDLPVLGMTCAACVRRVEKAVAALPGVIRSEINLPLSRASIQFHPSQIAVAALAQAIRGAGYQVPEDALHPQADGAERSVASAVAQAGQREQRSLRRDFYWAWLR
jgi:P-type Cu+ transporter